MYREMKVNFAINLFPVFQLNKIDTQPLNNVKKLKKINFT